MPKKQIRDVPSSAPGAEREQNLHELLQRHSYRPLLLDGGMVVLVNDDGYLSGGTLRIAGPVTSKITMLEMINNLATGHWRGELHVVGSGTHRALTFDQGALKSATSNQTYDRLGEQLVRGGVMTREELEVIVSQLPPHARFGQAVVQRGHLDQKQLYSSLKKQAEQIFFAVLRMQSGYFYFLEHDELSQAAASTTMHLSVQNLLMEGVQRIDEMELFRQKIPHMSACPEAQAGTQQRVEDADAERLLSMSDGRTSIEQLAQALALDEFEVTKLVYQLIQQGHVVLRHGPDVKSEEVETLVDRFNAVLHIIFSTAREHSAADATHETLSAWLEGSSYKNLFGERLDTERGVDPQRLMSALRNAELCEPELRDSQLHDPEREQSIESIYQALHELVAFTLFAATTSLPREQDLALTRSVNQQLKEITL